MTRGLMAAGLAAALLFTAPAAAQDPVDIGVIRDSDVSVVQKLLYPKKDRNEMGVHLGVMPFHQLLTTPNLQLSFDLHRSETFSLGAVLGGGFGIKNAVYRELESPKYGVAVDSYRYLGSALVGAQWAPVYAKANYNGSRVFHYDVYGAARAGASFEQSVIPAGGFALAPTVSLGIGSRFFVGERAAVRVELRDDMLVEKRSLTGTTHFKQNVNLTVGYTLLSKMPERTR